MELASNQLGIELKPIAVSGPEELNDAVKSAAAAGAAAMMLIDDPVIASYGLEIVSLASEAALPLFSIYSAYADAGALMAAPFKK